jgi:hypothetical protein
MEGSKKTQLGNYRHCVRVGIVACEAFYFQVVSIGYDGFQPPLLLTQFFFFNIVVVFALLFSSSTW